MSKHNTIGKGENQRAINGGDDKFYTKQFIADFYSHIVFNRYGEKFQYVEPTAGNGSFMNIIPNIVGYDLKPESNDIIEMDIFDNTFKKNDVIIGNPPFGMNASLAQSIFNHIASFDVKAICFIVPKTFKKISMHNKLNMNYKIVFEQDVIDNAFIVEGSDKNVSCVFQIWERTNTTRKPMPTVECEWIEFTTKGYADLAVRRAGGKAGQILDGLEHSETSTYFIKVKSDEVIKAIRLIDLSVIDNTAGVRSISKPELCYEINKVMEILK